MVEQNCSIYNKKLLLEKQHSIRFPILPSEEEINKRMSIIDAASKTFPLAEKACAHDEMNRQAWGESEIG